MSSSQSTLLVVKLCGCGCGQIVQPAKRSNRSRGMIKGVARDFVLGHRPATPETVAKSNATRAANKKVSPPTTRKLCECGCGGLAPIAKRSDGKTGVIKGFPQRYIKHHQPRACKTEITCPHPDRKHYGLGLCHPCWQKQWVTAHPHANTGNTWGRSNLDRRRLSSKRCRLKTLYGITMKQFEEMARQQEYRCANPRCSFVCPESVPDRRGFKVFTLTTITRLARSESFCVSAVTRRSATPRMTSNASSV